VLEVRWQIYWNLEKWPGGLEIASAIVKKVPDWPSGWIYRASSLTELNRHQEAYDTLADAVTRFPADEIILYDLACVCCALKRILGMKRISKPLKAFVLNQFFRQMLSSRHYRITRKFGLAAFTANVIMKH
jgi:hypothetical protein